MTDGVDSETQAVLERAAAELDAASAPEDVVDRLRALAGQVVEPCVVAVVGNVNAGKSTFLNALLGDDVAVVGSTETTATVNSFVYGPAGSERTVRCHWRSGHVTDETPEFLVSLQGHDDATLERAAGIARLEYALPIPMLRTISLIDTPGTGTVVKEHTQRTAEVLDLERGLRARHDEETRAIHERADAVVYVVGAVAQAGEEELLQRFAGRGGIAPRIMNTLGVLAKIDLSPELIERRWQLATKIGRQLQDELNVVVPVSAGLERALDQLGDDVLQRLIEVVHQLSAAHLELLLRDERLFTEYDPAGCAVSASDRCALYDAAGCEWRVFATIASAAAGHTAAGELRAAMLELAGFDVLRRTLHEHFLVRAQVLRCFRIADAARAVLKKLWFGRMIERRRRLAADTARLDRFLAFVASTRDDRETAAELTAHLKDERDALERRSSLEEVWSAVDADLAALLGRLGELSADFGALQELATSPDDFSAEETAELRALLGLYGADCTRRLRGSVPLNGCLDRQVRWRLARDRSRRGSVRWRVADRAHARLGLIIGELSGL